MRALLELVVAAEHDPVRTILPFAYQTTFQKALHVKAVFTQWGSTGKEPQKQDLSKSVAKLNGNPLNLLEYLNAWVNRGNE